MVWEVGGCGFVWKDLRAHFKAVSTVHGHPRFAITAYCFPERFYASLCAALQLACDL